MKENNKLSPKPDVSNKIKKYAKYLYSSFKIIYVNGIQRLQNPDNLALIIKRFSINSSVLNKELKKYFDNHARENIKYSKDIKWVFKNFIYQVIKDNIDNKENFKFISKQDLKKLILFIQNPKLNNRKNYRELLISQKHQSAEKNIFNFIYLITLLTYSAINNFASRKITGRINYMQKYQHDNYFIPLNLSYHSREQIMSLNASIVEQNSEIEILFKNKAAISNKSFLEKIDEYKSKTISEQKIYIPFEIYHKVNYAVLKKRYGFRSFKENNFFKILSSILIFTYASYKNGVFLKPHYFDFFLDNPFLKKHRIYFEKLENGLISDFYYLELYRKISQILLKELESLKLEPNTDNYIISKQITEILRAFKNYFYGDLISEWINTTIKIFNQSKTFLYVKSATINRYLDNFIFPAHFLIHKEDKRYDKIGIVDPLINYFFLTYSNISEFCPNKPNALYQLTLINYYFLKIGTLINVSRSFFQAIKSIINFCGGDFIIDEWVLLLKIIDGPIDFKESLISYDFFQLNQLSKEILSKYFISELRHSKIHAKIILERFKAKSFLQFFDTKKFLYIQLYCYFINFLKDLFSKEEISLINNLFSIDFTISSLNLEEKIFYFYDLKEIGLFKKDESIFQQILSDFINYIFKYFNSKATFLNKKSVLEDYADLKLFDKISKYKVGEEIFYGDIETSISKLSEENIINDIYSLGKYLKELLALGKVMILNISVKDKNLPKIQYLGFDSKLNGDSLDNNLIEFYKKDFSPQALKQKISAFNKEQLELRDELLKQIPKAEYLGFDEVDGAVYSIPSTYKPEDIIEPSTFTKISAIIENIKRFNNNQKKVLFDKIKTLPKIEDYNFRKNEYKFNIIFPNLSENEIKNKEEYIRFKNQILDFNREQKRVWDHYINNIPEIIDYGIPSYDPITSEKIFKPDAVNTLKEIKLTHDGKKLSQLIEDIDNWNNFQSITTRDKYKDLVRIYDLGFTNYFSGKELKYKKPSLDINKISEPDYLKQLSKQIHDFNEEQRNILNYAMNSLPQIEDLGFKIDYLGEPIKHSKPKVVIENIHNKNAYEIIKNQILDFNKEQKNILKNAISLLSSVNDLKFSVHPNGQTAKYKKPIINYQFIHNIKDIEVIEDSILKFNNEQAQILAEFKQLIPQVIDYGIPYYPSGEIIEKPDKYLNDTFLINKENIYLAIDKVKEFNNDQIKAKKQYLASIDPVLDFGFNEEDDLPPCTKPVIKFNNYQQFMRLIDQVKRWNIYQTKARSILLKKLPKIVDKGFRHYIDGTPYKHSFPFLGSDVFESKIDIINAIVLVNNFNQEQEIILKEHIRNLPTTDDLQIRINPVTRERIKHNIPSFQVEKIVDYKSWSNINKLIKEFNEEQKFLLNLVNLNTKQIVDYGFTEEDGVNIPKPALLTTSTLDNVDKIKTHQSNIIRWNNLQRELLNKFYSKIPAIKDLGYFSKFDGSPLAVSRDKLELFRTTTKVKKHLIDAQIINIIAFNQEQKSIFKDHLNNILRSIKSYGATKYIDNTHLKHQLPKTNYDESDRELTYDEIVILKQQIELYNQEQEKIFKKTLKSIPELVDFGFTNNDGITQKKPIYDVANIRSIEEIDYIVNKVNKWNDEQNTLFQKSINSLEKIEDLGFKTKNNSEPLEHEKPYIDVINIKSKQELVNLSSKIRSYNLEQRYLLDQLKHKIPNLVKTDFGIELNIINPSILDPTTLNTRDAVLNYIKTCNIWNEEQKKILDKKFKFLLDSVNDLGFKAYLDGSPLSAKLPNISGVEFLSEFDFERIHKKILDFNQEQDKILKQYYYKFNIDKKINDLSIIWPFETLNYKAFLKENERIPHLDLSTNLTKSKIEQIYQLSDEICSINRKILNRAFEYFLPSNLPKLIKINQEIGQWFFKEVNSHVLKQKQFYSFKKTKDNKVSLYFKDVLTQQYLWIELCLCFILKFQKTDEHYFINLDGENHKVSVWKAIGTFDFILFIENGFKIKIVLNPLVAMIEMSIYDIKGQIYKKVNIKCCNEYLNNIPDTNNYGVFQVFESKNKNINLSLINEVLYVNNIAYNIDSIFQTILFFSLEKKQQLITAQTRIISHYEKIIMILDEEKLNGISSTFSKFLRKQIKQNKDKKI